MDEGPVWLGVLAMEDGSKPGQDLAELRPGVIGCGSCCKAK